MPGTRAIGAVVAAAAFLAELAMIVLLAVIGDELGGPLALRVTLAVLLPAIVAVGWGRWMAPRSRHRLADPLRLVAQVLLFAAIAVVAAVAGLPGWGIAFAIVATGALALTRPFPEPSRRSLS